MQTVDPVISGNLALNNNWLSAPTFTAPHECDSVRVTTVGNVTHLGNVTVWPNDVTSCQPVYWPYYGYNTCTEHKPIRLSLAEVETLKKAAKQDPKLRDVLSKFTGQIEVIVDFK